MISIISVYMRVYIIKNKFKKKENIFRIKIKKIDEKTTQGPQN